MQYASTVITLGFVVCASGLALAQDSTLARFGDVSNLTADPTGLVRDPIHPPAPKFPRNWFGGRVTGSVVLAYVIDTAGHVEIQTASFLTKAPKEIVETTCAFLPRLSFQPFVVADQKWRVLLVDNYTFNVWPPDTAQVSAAHRLQQAKQEEFATAPVEKALKALADLPHCQK